MFEKLLFRALAAAAALGILAATAQGVTIDLVRVADPGNEPDYTRCGAVADPYWIGKYEITAGQYAEFLNAVAATDTYGLYNTAMWFDWYGCKVRQTGTSGAYSYSIAADWANRPVNYVSWGDAARFANWLHNGQPTGSQDLSTTEDGAYYLNGASSNAELMQVTRKPEAAYWIPSENQWYKAAYYKGGATDAGYWPYPTQSDVPPINTVVDPDPGNHANFLDFWGTGNNTYTIGSPYYRTEVGEFENSPGPYGTFDQGGNLWEWNEAGVSARYRKFRGGSFWNHANKQESLSESNAGPTYKSPDVGFRVAAIPEPGTAVLGIVGLLCGLWWWRKVAG